MKRIVFIAAFVLVAGNLLAQSADALGQSSDPRWYLNPVWIAIGVCALVVLVLLIAMAVRGGMPPASSGRIYEVGCRRCRYVASIYASGALEARLVAQNEHDSRFPDCREIADLYSSRSYHQSEETKAIT